MKNQTEFWRGGVCGEGGRREQWQRLATSRRGSGVALSEDEDKEFSFEK